MRTFSFQLPETLEMNEKEIAMSLALKLYEDGKLSLGQAAEMVGLSKRTFVELLGRYGVSLFNFPASELSNDIRNA